MIHTFKRGYSMKNYILVGIGLLISMASGAMEMEDLRAMEEGRVVVSRSTLITEHFDTALTAYENKKIATGGYDIRKQLEALDDNSFQRILGEKIKRSGDGGWSIGSWLTWGTGDREMVFLMRELNRVNEENAKSAREREELVREQKEKNARRSKWAIGVISTLFLSSGAANGTLGKLLTMALGTSENAP